MREIKIYDNTIAHKVSYFKDPGTKKTPGTSFWKYDYTDKIWYVWETRDNNQNCEWVFFGNDVFEDHIKAGEDLAEMIPITEAEIMLECM